MEYLHTYMCVCTLHRGREKGEGHTRLRTSRQHEDIIDVSLDKCSGNIWGYPLVFIIQNDYHTVLVFLGKKIGCNGGWWYLLT